MAKPNCRSFFFEFSPYLRERIPTRELDAIAGNSSPSNFDLDTRAMFTDQKFDSLVNDIYFYSFRRREVIDQALQEISEILQIIDREIDSSG